LNKKKTLSTDRLVIGGLHRDDFEWAVQQYEEIGYVLAAFILDIDGYHWKAVYVRANNLEKSKRTQHSANPRPPIDNEKQVSACFSKTKLETGLSHVGKSSPTSNKALKSPQKVKKGAINKEC